MSAELRQVAPNHLERAVERAWSSATSADRDGWSPDNPAWGQCAVTALIVQDYLGGDLLRAKVGEISHYWNTHTSLGTVDLTRRQFEGGAVLEGAELRTRAYVLSYPDTQRRYQILARRVRAILAGQ